MRKLRYDARHLTAVSAVLKERFTNLTVAETIKLTTTIIDALTAVEDEGVDEVAGPTVTVADISRFLVENQSVRNTLLSDNQLTIAGIQARNLERANRWHNGNFKNWSGLEWAGAMCGEAGEAANVAKKLRRLETGAAGNAWSDRPLAEEHLIPALGKEVADTFLYATLLCSRFGLNLASEVRRVFNVKSEEMGFPERI